MNEENKKVPENELNDEKLDKVTGGAAATRGSTFLCKSCKQNLPISEQSVNPDYCSFCYHYFIEPHEMDSQNMTLEKMSSSFRFPHTHK